MVPLLDWLVETTRQRNNFFWLSTSAPIHPPSGVVTLATNAPLFGWRAYVGGHGVPRTRGRRFSSSVTSTPWGWRR